MSKRLHLDAGDPHLFPPFLSSVQTLSPSFVSSEDFCFVLSAYGPLLFTSCVISFHLVPVPICLLISSCLHAIRFPPQGVWILKTLKVAEGLMVHLL